MKVVSCICAFLFSIFAFSQNWQNSFTEAVLLAKEENKPIILVFAGSDWCAPCIKLDKTIWQSDDFKTYSKKHYILYKADFPRKKANKLTEARTLQNNTLAERFDPKGFFPLVVVLDANEKVLGTTGYKKIVPNDYISLLNSFIK